MYLLSVAGTTGDSETSKMLLILCLFGALFGAYTGTALPLGDNFEITNGDIVANLLSPQSLPLIIMSLYMNNLPRPVQPRQGRRQDNVWYTCII